jgi:membrane protease YdiL (CAAX protease family)
MGAGALACLAAALGGTTCAGGALLAQSGAEKLAFSTLGVEIFLGLLAVACVVGGPVGPARRLGLEPGRLCWGHLGLLALGTVAFSFALDGLLELLRLRQGSVLADLDETLASSAPRELPLLLVSLVLAPAVAEELLCRGLVQRGLEVRWGPPAAIVLASCFFGALHMEAVHGTVAALLGLYLGAVAWLAAGIRASMACHLINNGVAVFTVTLLRIAVPSPAMLVAGLAVALLALAWVWWRAGTPEPLALPGA